MEAFNWLQTASAGVFDLDLVTSDDIRVEDIAHHLAQQNRYAGASAFPYSVAQHAVLGAQWILANLGDVELAYAFLHHDDAEYVLPDIPAPWKPRLPMYRAAEEWILGMVVDALGLPTDRWKEVKEIDIRILVDERDALHGTPPRPWPIDELGTEPLGVEIEPWDWERARFEFLHLHERLQATYKETP